MNLFSEKVCSESVCSRLKECLCLAGRGVIVTEKWMVRRYGILGEHAVVVGRMSDEYAEEVRTGMDRKVDYYFMHKLLSRLALF